MRDKALCCLIRRLVLLLFVMSSWVLAGCSRLSSFWLKEEPETAVSAGGEKAESTTAIEGAAAIAGEGSGETGAKERGAIESVVVDESAKSQEAKGDLGQGVNPIRGISGKDGSFVEVRWQIPQEPVEKYHLYYGSAPDKLDGYRQINTAALVKEEDPRHGPLFVYRLDGADAAGSLYVALRAENKHGLSERSQVLKIELIPAR